MPNLKGFESASLRNESAKVFETIFSMGDDEKFRGSNCCEIKCRLIYILEEVTFIHALEAIETYLHPKVFRSQNQ